MRVRTGAGGTPGVGCHTVAYEGFAAYRVEGVEYDGCGQADAIGRYPVHFHMAGAVPTGTYVRATAAHHSNFRAFTLHGTQGVTLERNVGYDSAVSCEERVCCCGWWWWW